MKKMILVLILCLFAFSGCTKTYKDYPEKCLTVLDPCNPQSCNYDLEKCNNANDNRLYDCQSDEDCVIISTSPCCGYVAVNKMYKNTVKEVLMVCEMYCPMEARCIESKCTVYNALDEN